MTFKEAATKILDEEKKPLSANELVTIALSRKYIKTDGNTPEATMAAVLYSDIKSNNKTKFQKVGRGKFALKKLKESASDPLILVKRQNDIVKEGIKKRLHDMDDSQFEYLVADLLQKMGYEDVEVTGKSGDEGIDVFGVLTAGGLTSVPTVVQVKQYRNQNVGPNYIRELRGSARVGQRGLIVTLSKFTSGAVNEAKADGKMPVSLVDGNRLIDLMIENRIGIKEENVVVRSIDDEYFSSEDNEETHIDDSDKFKVMWPLPGGVENYIRTLESLLEVIGKGKKSQKELVQWFINTFEDVTSEKTSQGYLRVPRYMGLIIINKGKVSLTVEGEKYIKNRDHNFLFELIGKNILAFDDMYQFIESVDSPVTEKEILEFLKENFDIEWTTFNQIYFRLRWMLNLGKIKKIENGFTTIDM